MTRKIPLPIIVLVGVVSTLYLICSMILFSTIIVWISLDFSPNLAGPLAFIVGSLSLISAIIGILMVGISRLKKSLGIVFFLLTLGLILITVGLTILFMMLYDGGNADVIGKMCEECEQFGKRTQVCVDHCNDECCFTNYSEPLAFILIALTGLSLLTSVVGLGTAVAHLSFAFRPPHNVKNH